MRTYLGTRAFLPARGHGHLLGDRVLLCFLGDMGIFWLLRDRVLFACSGTHFPLLGDRSPLYLGHLLPPWEQDHIRLPGDKTPDYTPGTRSLLPAWGHGHLLAPWGQGPWPSPSSGTQLDGRPLRRAPHSSSGPPQVSWAGNNTEVAPRTAHLAWFNLITPNLRRHWHQDWGVPATHWGLPSSHQFLHTGAGGITGTVLRVPADCWGLPSTYLFSHTGAGGSLAPRSGGPRARPCPATHWGPPSSHQFLHTGAGHVDTHTH